MFSLQKRKKEKSFLICSTFKLQPWELQKTSNCIWRYLSILNLLWMHMPSTQLWSRQLSSWGMQKFRHTPLRFFCFLLHSAICALNPSLSFKIVRASCIVYKKLGILLEYSGEHFLEISVDPCWFYRSLGNNFRKHLQVTEVFNLFWPLLHWGDTVSRYWCSPRLLSVQTF